MGGFLDKPKINKITDHGFYKQLRYGVSSMQGWRCEMEDAYFVQQLEEQGLEGWSFFAVFDGHAGSRVSQICAQNLLQCIVETEEFQKGSYVDGIREGFLYLDRVMRRDVEKCGGTTVVCALISPDKIYMANCGDSRAVLFRNGKVACATVDHKPNLPEEKRRINNAGGSVMVKRVNGTLAVSRALGDYDFKNVKTKGQCEQLVSPEPEIFTNDLDDTDEFLVLACDGVWDVMSNEDVCSFIDSRLKITDDLVNIASQVIDTCLYKGSRDNMSIIIITFPAASKPREEDIEADNRLEKHIEEITREELTTCNENKHIRELFKTLEEKEIPGLPPGGGLYSKYAVIERIYNELKPEDEEEYLT